MAFRQNYTTNNVDTIQEKIGFNLPFTLENENQTITTFDAIKTNLKNLISTQKGERLFQPNLGIDLKKHLFDPISSENLISLQEDIAEQIQVWLPFIEVNDIQVNLKEDENTINFIINFSLKSDTTKTDSVQINVNTGATY